MPTHRDIAPTETDPQAPITAALMKALDENLDAVVDDDPTAPKIRRRHSIGGVAAVTQTFTGLGDYSGIAFEVFLAAGGAVQNTNFQYSTNNGGSWSASTLLGSAPANGFAIFLGSFDFATGLFRVVGYQSTPSLSRISTNIAGASLDINAVRFTGTANIVAQIKPNGGVA